MGLFEWLLRRKIISLFIDSGIDNLVFTLFINLMLLAFVFLAEVGLPLFFYFFALNNVLNFVAIFLFSLFLFILSFLIIVFAVVEYHNRNINTCKE